MATVEPNFQSVAVLKVRGREGVFAAESWSQSGGRVTATGRTRRRTGVNYEETRWGPRRTYCWLSTDVISIEELTGEVA